MSGVRYILFAPASILFMLACSGQEPAAAEPVNVPPAELSSEEQPDAAFTSKLGGHNVTGEFRECFRDLQPHLTDENKKTLNQYDILLVHGFLGEVGIKVAGFLDKFSSKQHLVDYLKDQRKASEELGLTVKVARFRSESLDASAIKIAKTISENERPMIVFSHSKGSLDTLDALLRLEREGKLSHVAGWISCQGPFYGSPDADEFFQHPLHFLGNRILVKLLGADVDAIRDLTTTEREHYVALHRTDIERITKKIPVLCFASWEQMLKAKSGSSAPGAGAANELFSDGSLPAESAILPGTDYIAKSGISHSMTVIKRAVPYDRVTFTKTLLVMLSERIKQAQEQASSLQFVEVVH